MENSKMFYIETDNNIIINEKCIKWVKKMGDCLEICTKSDGCYLDSKGDTHKICKLNNINNYNKLNKHFK